jgi:hypothetical protein
MLFYLISQFYIYKFSLFRRNDFGLLLFVLVSIAQMGPVACDRHYYWAFLPTIPVLIFYFLDSKRLIKTTKYGHYLCNLLVFVVLFNTIGEILFRINSGVNRYKSESCVINIEQSFVLNGMKVNHSDSLLLFNYLNSFNRGNSYKKVDVDKSGMAFLLPYVKIKKFNWIQSDSIFWISNKNRSLEMDSFPYYIGWKHPYKRPSKSTFLYCSKNEFSIY